MPNKDFRQLDLELEISKRTLSSRSDSPELASTRCWMCANPSNSYTPPQTEIREFEMPSASGRSAPTKTSSLSGKTPTPTPTSPSWEAKAEYAKQFQTMPLWSRIF